MQATEQEFLLLLESTRRICLDDLKYSGIKDVTGNDFEKLVFEAMVDCSVGTVFEDTIEQTGAHGFPDIIANQYFGVEVKVTTGDKWKSTGNSILESTRIANVERIYLFFGKIGGNTDIKFRLYEECLYEIAVTHSPRYQIDMLLEEGKSVFDKLGLTYESLRKSRSPIRTFKNHLRAVLREGEELWWVDSSEDVSVSPVITPFRLLDSKNKEDFQVRCMIFFPEIFGKKSTKFERAAAYLIAKYGAISPNLRDLFTAGGKRKITLYGKEILVPAIYFRLLEKKDELKSLLVTIPVEDLLYYWRIDKKIDISNKLEIWLSILDSNANGLPEELLASQIFSEGTA